MIGIRREDKNRWERRAPLTPDHVAEMVRNHGIRFRVEPSALRAFPDLDYEVGGAELGEDLSSCATVLGVKEVPPSKVLPGKAYLLFAHVTKGQPQNMPMLRRFVERGSTLVDYECVRDERGRRILFFGRHAGHAGMIDVLWALGRRLVLEGFHTPFEEIRLAHEYSGLDEAGHHISRVGERLRHTGIPRPLHPIVFGFTGSGNVTRGALEIFDRLPFQEVAPEDLASLADDRERPRNVVFKVLLLREHRYERADGGFDAAELEAHPERYQSVMDRWLPHLTVLVNGAYWVPPLPTLVRIEDLRRLWSRQEPPRLRILGDLACDIGGAIEATVRVTTPSDPVYTHDVTTGEIRPGIGVRGPIVLAVDNLPCELPVESSQHFGDALVRYVPALDRCRWEEPLDDLPLPREIRRAVVVHRGRLTPEFAYLEKHLASSRAPAKEEEEVR